MDLHNEIFNRVRKTLGRFAPERSRSSSRADYLMKMNLAPLMGRRDAAGDRIGELIRAELFLLPESERRDSYRVIGELLDEADRDTRAILDTLSSPDTAGREHRLLAFWTLLREIAAALNTLTGLENTLFGDRPADADELIRSDTDHRHDEQLLHDCEISLVNQFREFVDRAAPQLARYREYAAKSFSKPYAERYRKAYAEYTTRYAARR